jgi:hypothetical protein
MLTFIFLQGLPPLGDRDAHLLRPHRPSPVHLATQALHIHLGEPNRRETPVWNEGTMAKLLTVLPFANPNSDHLYIHSHPVC